MPPLSFSATQLTLARLRVWVAEWAFWDSWSIRAEYDFIGLNNQSFASGNAPAPFGNAVFTSNNRNIQLVTAGVNYKFGGW